MSARAAIRIERPVPFEPMMAIVRKRGAPPRVIRLEPEIPVVKRLRLPGAVLAALALVGCIGVQSPTEPARSHLTITPQAGACAFVVGSEPPIEEPATWTAYKDGAAAFSGTMTTQGHTIGAANFTGRYELAVIYRGRETRGAMECGK